MILPDFADDQDRANHDALLARGYRYGGHDGLRDAWRYHRRFPAAEARGDGADKCCVSILRYDMSRYRRAGDEPISYQAELYFETAAGHAGRMELYGLRPGDLLERLPLLEEQCLAVWGLLSRRERVKHDLDDEETKGGD